MPVKKRQKTAKKQYEPEVLYTYWSAAGGKVQAAIRLAAEANDRRTPKRAQTWADYATQHEFAARLKADEKARSDAYHAERAARQQQVLDDIAFTFEQVSEKFLKTIALDLAVSRSDDKDAAAVAIKRLNRLFGDIHSVDKFFRMYLRSRDLPERMTQTSMDHTGAVPVTYGDLEGKPKPKTVDEAKALAEKQDDFDE